MIAIARVLVMCSLMVALAGSTPVACWCDPSVHAGQPLHPFFPHTHADDSLAEPDDAETASDRQAPSWTAQTASGVPVWSGSLQALPVPILAAFMPLADRPLAERMSRPTEHLDAPTFPPPR